MIMTSNSNVMAKPKESKIVFNDSSIPTWLEGSASPEQSEDKSSASDPWLSENVLLTNPGPTLPESVVPNIISEHGNIMNNSKSKQRKRLRTSSFGNVSPAKCSASEAVAQDDMSSSSNDDTSTAAADTQPHPPLAKAVSPSSDTGEDVIIDDCTFSDDDDCVVLPTTAAPPAAAPAPSPPIARASRAGRRGPPPPGNASEPVPFGVDEVVPVDERTVLVTTTPDFCLLLWGAFQVRVLRGALRVHGALLTPARAQFLPVFALRVKALPPLLSAENCAADNTAPAGVPALPAEAAAALERAAGTALLLRRLPSHLLSLLAAKLGDTFTPRPDSQDAVLSRVGCRLLRAADELHQLGLNTFATSAEWEAQLRQLEVRSTGKERLRVVFAGGKGVGKSSWMYHVLNLLLNTRRHVYVLDLDPGQAEFTPCACLSLVKVDTFIVGPSFTHLTEPVRSVFLGEVSVANDPSGYLDAAHQLATAYRQLAETDPAPLLINTMGWGSGLGEDLLLEVLGMTQPTDLLEVRHPYKDNFNFAQPLTPARVNECGRSWLIERYLLPDAPLRPAVTYRYSALYSPGELTRERAQTRQRSQTSTLAPWMYRQLNTTAFVASLEQEDRLLCQITPVCVAWSSLAVEVMGQRVLPPHLMHAVNGTVVALCRSEPATWLRPDDPSMFALLPRPRDTPTCLGFGLVRGVDPERRLLYLLTDLSPERLGEVNTLLRGPHHLLDVFLAGSGLRSWTPALTKGAPSTPLSQPNQRIKVARRTVFNR